VSDGRTDVSVVIPAFNRGAVIGRAVESCRHQSLEPVEILVVDDCSTDDTRDAVEAMAAEDRRIRLVRPDRHRGAAAARNAGISAARAGLVAFLDSDDEWLETHLERKVGLLNESRAGLVFGSLYLQRGGKRIELHCRKLAGDPLEYLFLQGGGFRTSTFVGEKSRLEDVMFDESLFKHQDWDLVVNFHRRFPVATDSRPTAILHVDGKDRLSTKPNHQATERFFSKNRDRCSALGWMLFATVMMEATYRAEGGGSQFRRYLELVRELDPAAYADVRRLAALLHVPRIGGRLFRAASRSFCAAAARRRPDLLKPASTA
jgi:glycosyltransferase involved in cell wall biosynthesis